MEMTFLSDFQSSLRDCSPEKQMFSSGREVLGYGGMVEEGILVNSSSSLLALGLEALMTHAPYLCHPVQLLLSCAVTRIVRTDGTV